VFQALANGSEPSHILRHSVILASLLNCPQALPSVEAALEDLQFEKPLHRDLQQFLLQFSGSPELLWFRGGTSVRAAGNLKT
jgi:hypothetical protein